MENWTLTAPSNPGFEFFYLATLLVGMPNSPLFLDVLPGAAVLTRPRSSGGAVDDPYSFDVLPDLDTLAEAQGVSPTTDVRNLATDDWPEDESVEDFIAAAMEGRYEEDEPDS
jgi:hypothetical protein